MNKLKYEKDLESVYRVFYEDVFVGTVQGFSETAQGHTFAFWIAQDEHTVPIRSREFRHKESRS